MKIGEIADHVCVEELNTPLQRTDYKKVLQLIETTDPRLPKYLVRLGYYWRDSDKPNSPYKWGSQTTFQLPLKMFKRLLAKAERKRML